MFEAPSKDSVKMPARYDALPLWFTGARQKYGYVFAVLAVAGCTLLSSHMQLYFQLPNIVMVYLAVVALVAYLAGRGPSIMASIMAALAFDFFNVPPHFLLSNSDGQYLLTLIIMLSISILISSLTSRLRDQLEQSHQREQRTALLYALTRELAATRGVEALGGVIARHIEEAFTTRVQLLLPEEDELRAIAGRLQEWSDVDAVQLWEQQGDVRSEKMRALEGAAGWVGLLLFAAAPVEREGERLLHTMLSAAALAIERARSVDEVQAERMKVETERLRNSLLSAVSHDLRTPLATIVGASSSLIDDASKLDADAVASLHRVVYQSSLRMRSLVENILDMARLQSGPVHLRQEWQTLEEVLGAALQEVRPGLAERRIEVDVPPDLPLLRFDSVLMQRVFINLLENAIKYTPPHACLYIAAAVDGAFVRVSVADDGPGLSEEERERVFEKFYRGSAFTAASGAGLGLAICRAIVEAHDGRISAEMAPQGGACFVFFLRLEAQPDTTPVSAEEVLGSER